MKKHYLPIKLERVLITNKNNQGKKQVEAFKVLKSVENQQKPKSIEGIFPNDLENSEVQNDLNEIKELEKQINRNDLI